MAKKFEINAEIIKKYLFWSCTPIGLAVAVFTIMTAIGSITEDMDKQKTQLESQKKSLETLRGAANSHPNEGTISAVNEQTEILKGNVFDAWKIMVEQQDQHRWVWTGLARSAIQNIENTVFLGDLQPSTRESYRDYARDEINLLLDKADIKRVQQYRVLPNGTHEPLDPPRLAESRGRGMSGSSSGMSGSGSGSTRGTSSGISSSGTRTQMMADGSRTTLKGKVAWDRPEALEFSINNWNDRPESFEVWLTQEDLEVYKAVLWVIAKSNENAPEQQKFVVLNTMSSGSMGMGSDSMGMSSGSGSRGVGGDPLDLSASVVKQILDIAIGSPAARQLEAQSNRRITGRGAGMGGSGMGGSGMGGSGMGGSGMGRSASPEAARANAMAGRYVDVNGNPLKNIDLTGQFRRMPVYLSLLVEQLSIPEILVNCANCPMPIDVLWVTINPGATANFAFSSSGSATGGSLGGSSGGAGRGGGSSSTRGMSSSSSMSSSMSSSASSGRGSSGRMGTGAYEFGPDAVVINIYGCINIFAPPDREKISGSSAAPGLSPGAPNPAALRR